MKIRFQWFFDFQTEAGKMQIFTVSAGGDYVRKRLLPFFSAYKYYKLGKVSCMIRPSSTLPIDPLGLSYDDDDPQTVDPRDQLSPGLTRITNGEDFLDDLTGVSENVQRNIYLNMMLDTRWYKWNMQGGLKRVATPKYWQIGQLHQDYFPGVTINVPKVPSGSEGDLTTTNTLYLRTTNGSDTSGSVTAASLNGSSDPRGLFQTGHKGKLSWMPTDALIHYSAFGSNIRETPSACAIPEIEVFKFITPPMYKTKYYFRCYVTEEVYFAAPMVNNSVMGDPTSIYQTANGSLDRFVYDAGQIPALPTAQINVSAPKIGTSVAGQPNDGSSTDAKDSP